MTIHLFSSYYSIYLGLFLKVSLIASIKVAYRIYSCDITYIYHESMQTLVGQTGLSQAFYIELYRLTDAACIFSPLMTFKLF